MEIQDTKGKYRLKVDLKRNIVYETQIGYWKPEDLVRFHDEYIYKIYPLLKGKVWAKCCDLRNYKTSMITLDIQKHVQWAAKNGFSKAAIILDDSDPYSSVIKLQMEVGTKETDIHFRVFTSVDEADEWLKKEGFCL